MKKITGFLTVLAVLLCCGIVYAQATMSDTADGTAVKAAGYSSSIAKDGCVTSISINGQEFLNSTNAMTRGAYFFTNGMQTCPNVKKVSTDTIVATGSLSEITYHFAPNSMVWNIRNISDQDITFFIIIDASIKALRDESGNLLTSPTTFSTKKATWFKGESKLTVDGIDRLWGPWDSGHQVIQVDIAPKQSRVVNLQMDSASPAETAAVTKMLADIDARLNTWLYSPKEYQVFQRQSKYKGRALISGRTKVPCDKLEYRLTGKPLSGKFSAKWRSLPLCKKTGIFTHEVIFPAGGWYKLEIRAIKDRKIVDQAIVDRFGVGEVFVGAGQSNSTNCGQEQTSQKSNMVSSFNGTEWRLANDPQWGAHDNSQGGSFWPAFGDAMYAKYKVPIGVAVTGHGGTSVNQWNTDGELFNWMIQRIKALGPGGFRAVLWHQGESDTGMTSDAYYQRMKTLINDSTRKAGWYFPWFVAQVSYHNVQDHHYESTRSAQKKLWDTGIAFEGPDTDVLGADYRDYNGAGIHFSPKGLLVHGKLWVEKVSVYMDSILK